MRVEAHELQKRHQQQETRAFEQADADGQQPALDRSGRRRGEKGPGEPPDQRQRGSVLPHGIHRLVAESSGASPGRFERSDDRAVGREGEHRDVVVHERGGLPCGRAVQQDPGMPDHGSRIVPAHADDERGFRVPLEQETVRDQAALEAIPAAPRSNHPAGPAREQHDALVTRVIGLEPGSSPGQSYERANWHEPFENRQDAGPRHDSGGKHHVTRGFELRHQAGKTRWTRRMHNVERRASTRSDVSSSCRLRRRHWHLRRHVIFDGVVQQGCSVEGPSIAEPKDGDGRQLCVVHQELPVVFRYRE